MPGARGGVFQGAGFRIAGKVRAAVPLAGGRPAAQTGVEVGIASPTADSHRQARAAAGHVDALIDPAAASGGEILVGPFLRIAATAGGIATLLGNQVAGALGLDDTEAVVVVASGASAILRSAVDHLAYLLRRALAMLAPDQGVDP